MKSNLFLKILFFVFLQLGVSTAQAHAFIEQQQPKAGEELNSSPKAIILTYNKNIESVFSSIQLINETSQTVIKTDKAKGVEGDPRKLLLSLPKLSVGNYRVKWVVLSRDGHRTMGDYIFSIH